VDLVIAGGMGIRAQDLFQEKGIDLIVGVTRGDPEEIIEQYLEGRLVTGENICDH
jgi:predicted Fe-Mo cluster-binding NifX family protein